MMLSTCPVHRTAVDIVASGQCRECTCLDEKVSTFSKFLWLVCIVCGAEQTKRTKQKTKTRVRGNRNSPRERIFIILILVFKKNHNILVFFVNF